MKTVVCIKAVPGVVLGAKVSASGDSIEYRTPSLIANEGDEYALEEALALRGKCGGQVIAVSLGPAPAEDVLRSALAKGADRVIRVDSKHSDAARTALALAGVIRGLQFDLVLAGLESWDNMSSQVAIAAASWLGIPFVFGATKITPEDGKALLVTRELGGGRSQVLEVSLPALVCTQTGIRRLSHVPFAKLVQARRRAIESVRPAQAAASLESPPPRQSPVIVDVFTPQRTHAIEMLAGTPAEVARRAVDIMERAR